MYSHITWPSSAMQNCNYFCTNLTPNDLTIYFGVYTPQNFKAGSQRDICTPTFTAALSQQPRGGSNPNVHQHEWMKKRRYIYAQQNVVQP